MLFFLVIFPVFLQEKNLAGEIQLPLESGFWCLSGGGVKFRLQFFTILIIFVLFDLEVILLAPLIFFSFPSYKTFFLILIFVILTLILEWW